ncbi:MAG: DUF4249 family protein [Bacteroidetes bacterium]|nr:DUF4249 family protein [Bacteroidota bacterium]
MFSQNGTPENNVGNYYSSGFSLQPGSEYEIRVNVDGMPKASAVVTISDPRDTVNHYMLGVYYFENDQYNALQAETEDPDCCTNLYRYPQM